MPKVYILYLVYKDKNEKKGTAILSEICKKLFPVSKQIIITIDNSIENSNVFKDESGVRISGNNTAFEFSGWDAGYDYLINNFIVRSEDFILYANDTFHQRSYADGGLSYLEFFDAKFYDFQSADMRNVAIGYLDDFPKKVFLMNIHYVQWIRSNIFILSSEVSKKLHPLTFPIKKEQLFGASGEPFFKETQYMSKNWRGYISSWLFGSQDVKYPEYNLTWIKFAALNELNRDFFKIKCIAILSEHYLSARLQSLGVQIFNTNLFPKRENRHQTNYYQNTN